MQKELVCIRCPIGCRLTVTGEPDMGLEVSGNRCQRGEEYAKRELTHPTRIVTSTVRVRNGQQAVVSVKTKEDIPKGKMAACIEALKNVELEAPVYIGDTVLANAADTGVDIVVTQNVPEAGRQ